MLTQSLFDEGAIAPCPAPFNLAAYVLAHAATSPDKAALELWTNQGPETWSFAELENAVLCTATGLNNLGLKRDARILLRLGNCVDFPILFLAAIAAGFQPVPTSSQLTKTELTWLIDNLEPDLVITAKEFMLTENPFGMSRSAESVQALGQGTQGEFVYGDPDRPAYVIYTSGTSGQPRGVVHAHRAVWARRMMWQGWYDLKPTDRLLHAGAFNWTYTLGTGLMDPWAIGATALIPKAETPNASLLPLLKKSQATLFAAAPGVYRQILKSADTVSLPQLRHGLSAGEKLPTSIARTWYEKTGTKIYEALGMSEVSTFVSTAPKDDVQREAATGRPQYGRRIAVVDAASGAPVPVNTPGILAVSSRDSGLMLGYLNDEDATQAKFKGEWFLTGDSVKMGPNGDITFLGRDDDMMNAGGYRVSPLEIENVLNSHTDIIESAAVAVEIKSDTFVIAAFYVSEIELDERVLAHFCADRLAKYKTPGLFQRLTALPKGANNKLKRGTLRRNFRDAK